MGNLVSWFHGGHSDTVTTAITGWDRMPDGVGYVRRRVEGQIFDATSPQPLDTVPLCRWFSESRHDYFTTSDPAWRGSPGDTRSPDYLCKAIEGYIFDRPLAGTIPLYAWYNNALADNLLSSDPSWRGAPGDERSGYRFVRIEGYVIRSLATDDAELAALGTPSVPIRGRMPLLVIVADLADRAVRFHDIHYDQLIFGMDVPSDAGTVAAFRWHSPSRSDHFLTTDPAWAGTMDSQLILDYRFVRVEGYVRLFTPGATPRGMRVLNRWWDGTTQDNFTTSDPAWIGSPGTTKGSYSFSNSEAFVFDPTGPQPPGTVMLHRWRSAERGDEFTTSDPAWVGRPGDLRDGYGYVQPEGFVNRRPAPDLVPLCSWFSLSRGDNILQATAPFTVDVRSPDYVLARLECRFFDPGAPRPPGTVPLHAWWHGTNRQHLLSSDPSWTDPSRPAAAGYRHVRLEGYVFDPERPQPSGTVPLLRWDHTDGRHHFTTSDPAFGIARPPGGDWRLGRREGYALPPQQIAESVTGTYAALSNNLLQFSRVSVVRIQLPQTVDEVLRGDESFIDALDEDSVRRAAALVDLHLLSTGGRIMPQDLRVIRVLPTVIAGEVGLAQTRDVKEVEVSGLRIMPWYSACDELGDVNLFAHELRHTLGFGFDIYGPTGSGVNSKASLCAASFSFPGPGSISLDPWHRLRAGWLRPPPSVAYIREPGSSILLSGSALLLYDPQRGVGEFFLVEYRAPGLGGPPWFDAGVLGQGRGVLVWYIQTLPSGDLAPFPWPPPFSAPVTGGSMVANYLVAPNGTFGGPPVWSDTTGSTAIRLQWGNGSAADLWLAVRVEDGSAWVEWRPSADPLMPRLDSVTPGLRADRETEGTLSGRFPLAGVRATLRRPADTRSWELRIVEEAPTRTRVIVPAVPAGDYEFVVAPAPGAPARLRSNRIAYAIR